MQPPLRLIRPEPSTVYPSRLIVLDRARGHQRFERDICAGLSSRPKHVSSMYLYDDAGSDLFRDIMELPEYYVTRVEREILSRHAGEIVEPLLTESTDVVDLGAGDGVKTLLLLERLQGRDARYVPIDVSPRALHEAWRSCNDQLPKLAVVPVRADYFAGVTHIAALAPERRRMVLLLGSNIGNLERPAVEYLLRGLRNALQPGDLVLIGFDLVKDPEIMQRAYDDADGVTARFNLNLLERVNRELAGTFCTDEFRHHATYSHRRQAMESYLVSTRHQEVSVGRRSFTFDAWEPILTEISCKYRESEVGELAQQSGFEEVERFFDDRRYFVDALWTVPGKPRPARFLATRRT